jgi:hypothetical protein
MISAPSHTLLKQYGLEELASYWGGKKGVLALPIPAFPWLQEEPLPPQMKFVTLPVWARDVGIKGGILVPMQFSKNNDDSLAWVTTDWFSAIFWYLNGIPEQAFEAQYGPIHSYSYHLKGWDQRLWDHAWVNRIALFLRRWAATEAQRTEEDMCGPLPKTDIILTHDLDAICKTFAIRMKQSAFHSFNAINLILKGQYKAAVTKFLHALRFFLYPGDFDYLDDMCRLEESNGLRSLIHVYGGRGGWCRMPIQILIDPAYNLGKNTVTNRLKDISKKGWQIGLHQSFQTWDNAAMIQREREKVETVLGRRVTACRQHWLRFSWRQTWKAQQTAGFFSDSTLGFNDRPGFRNGAALAFHPWDFETNSPMILQAMPLVLMDSHLYDYAQFSEEDRTAETRRWVNEIHSVSGAATLLWHPHTLGRDYGWRKGFENLLADWNGHDRVGLGLRRSVTS